MTQFDEKKQDERLHGLRVHEEEQLAEMLAGKYGVEYIDLTSRSVDTDALRLIPEAEARQRHPELRSHTGPLSDLPSRHRTPYSARYSHGGASK